MATFVKLIHNGAMKTVALCEGLSSEELTGLLKTVFNISGNIVGIMAEVPAVCWTLAATIDLLIMSRVCCVA